MFEIADQDFTTYDNSQFNQKLVANDILQKSYYFHAWFKNEWTCSNIKFLTSGYNITEVECVTCNSIGKILPHVCNRCIQ